MSAHAAKASAIRRLEDKRRIAMLAGDAEALLELCDAELAYTHSDGSQDTRSSYIGKVAAGYFVYRQLSFETSSIEVCTDTALVHGRVRGDVDVEGRTRVLNCSFLAVWSERGGAWKFRAFQPTPIASIAP